MDQPTINKVKTGIQIFGVVMGIVAVTAFIWSLTRPAVTTGPMPEAPSPTEQTSP